MEAISSKDGMWGKLDKLETKIKQSNSNLEKLNSGKSTMKTLFKSNTSKANEITRLTNVVALTEGDIEYYKKLINITIVHLSWNVIPTFKRQKVQSFVNAIKRFSDAEIGNSNELV